MVIDNEPVGKFARWVAVLQSYDFDISYRPGRVHTNADGVSRRTYDTQDSQLDGWDELPSFDCISMADKSNTHSTNMESSKSSLTCAAAARIANDNNLSLSSENIRENRRNDA